MDILFIIFALFVWFLMAAFGYWMNWKSWNKGICKETGEPWIYFDTDSQGGRGYKSIGNGYQEYTWISWPGIDRKPNNDS